MSRLQLIVPVFLGILLAAGCGDDESDSSPTPTVVTATPTSSATSTPTTTESPTATATPNVYFNDRFGYSIELPEGWRPASAYMDAFGASRAEPEVGGKAEDYLVLTSLTTEEETASINPNYWLGFFRLATVEIFPIARDLHDQLTSMDGVGYFDKVSDIEEVPLDGGLTATRYTVERYNDEDYYIYDRAFVPGPVSGCPTCTGFVIQTVVAGRPKSEPATTVDPPPASYPVEEFELILESFRFAGALAEPDSHLGIRPVSFQKTADQVTAFSTVSGGFALEIPTQWKETASSHLPGYFHVGWIDAVAQGMPPLQFDIDQGGGIEIQAMRGEQLFFSEADLVNSIIGAASDPAFSAEVIDSQTTSVDGQEAYLVTYLTSVEDHIERVTKVIWQDEAISFMLRLSVVANGAEDAQQYDEALLLILSSFRRTDDTRPLGQRNALPATELHDSLLATQFLTLPATVPLTITSGWLYDNGVVHCAMDYVDGTPSTNFSVRAATDGLATFHDYARENTGGLGSYVSIRHEINGEVLYTQYAHLATSPIGHLQTVPVSRGQEVGTAGSTGTSAVHLHFVLGTNSTNACNGGATTAVDSYDNYQTRWYYPPYGTCGANHYWTTCPPIFTSACITPTPPYPDGSLWRMEHDTGVYVMWGQTRYWIHSPTDFDAMHAAGLIGDWNSIQCATDGSLWGITDIPYDKTLFKDFGTDPIYLAACSAKFWVPNVDVLNTLIANGWANNPVYQIPPGEAAGISDVPFNGCRMQEYGIATIWLTCPDPARKFWLSPYAWSIFSQLDSNVRVVWPGALNGMATTGMVWLRTCPDGDNDNSPAWGDLSEQFIGTTWNIKCALTSTANDEIDRWPPDFNDNQWTNVGDYNYWTTYAPFGSRPTDPNSQYDPRFDLNTNELINLGDLLTMNIVMNTNCN